MGDEDIFGIIRELSKHKELGYNSPLLVDEETGEFFLIREGIHKDEDDDIIIPIQKIG